MIDVAKRAFAIAGYGYSVTMMPFPRALQLLVEGKYDARAICNKADVSEGGWACIFLYFLVFSRHSDRMSKKHLCGQERHTLNLPWGWFVEANTLGDGMRQLRKAGEFAKILACYGMQDWEKGY